MAKPVPPSLSDVARNLARQDHPFANFEGEGIHRLGQLLSGARVRCTFDDEESGGRIKSFEAQFELMILAPTQHWCAVFTVGTRRRMVQADLIHRFEVLELQGDRLSRVEPDLVAHHTARRR